MKDVFLIQKTVLDPWENEASAAVIFTAVGFVETEEEAEAIWSNSRMFTAKDCWALLAPMKEYTYVKLNNLKLPEMVKNQKDENTNIKINV